jgi:hypothetical protein
MGRRIPARSNARTTAVATDNESELSIGIEYVAFGAAVTVYNQFKMGTLLPEADLPRSKWKILPQGDGRAETRVEVEMVDEDGELLCTMVVGLSPVSGSASRFTLHSVVVTSDLGVYP